MKKKLKKLFNFILFIMLFFCALVCNFRIAEAKEDSYDYYLDANTDYISFGHLTQNSKVNYQEIVLYNDGDEAIDIIWCISDPDGFVNVDAPSNSYIAPFDSISFYVTANTNVSVGSHSATLYFADKSDQAYLYGVDVDLSMTMDKSTPQVTAVNISPSTINTGKNSYLNFTAEVVGINNPAKSVTWSISGQTGNSIISNDGILNVAANENSNQITVKATSTENSAIYGTAIVNIVNDKYTVSVTANNNGGIVSGGATVSEGESVTVTASPSNGYQFVNWTLNGNQVSTNARYQINNIKSNMSLVANFKQINCSIHLSSNHTYGGYTSGDTTVPYGSKATITATANPGYKFNGWYEGNTKISDKSSYTISSVKENHSFVADFSPSTYTISVVSSPNNGGTATGQGTFDSGTYVNLTAKPAQGYEFAGWFLNGTEYSKNKDITVNALSKDYNFTAYFIKSETKTVTLVSSVNTNNGTISPEGNYFVPEGANVTYSIAAKTDYRISDVKVDNVSVGPVSSYTFTNVNTTHSITAYFEKIVENSQNQTNSNGTNSNAANNTNTNNTNANNANADNTNSNSNTNNNTNNNNSNANNNINSNTNNNGSNANGNEVVEEIITGGESDYARDTRDYNLDDEQGLLQYYNITADEAILMMKNGQGREMFEKAIDDGTFQLSIYNDLSNDKALSNSFDELSNRVPNIETVVADILTQEDLIKILESKKADISINLFDNSGFIDSDVKTMIDNYAAGNLSIAQYFEIVILKSVDSYTSEITTLSSPMRLVIDIPESLKSTGRKFFIIRTHTDENGNTSSDCLTDLDNNDNTITFETDRFSSYAIAYENTDAHNNNNNDDFGETERKNSTIKFFVIAAVSLVILTILALLLQKFIASSNRKDE